MDHIQQFADAIASAGISVPEHIIDDGELHRFSTNGRPSDKSGWYILHGDGIPAGHFGCFRAGVDQSFSANVGRRLTDEELAHQRRALKEAKRKREAALEADRAYARTEASAMWNRAGKPNGHAYIKAKQVTPHGARELDDMLLVPVYDQHKALVGLQRIYPSGDKRFLRGTPAAGSYMSIGADTSRIVVCEGWATGSTIHDATGRTVVVAFNAGNLMAVAKIMRAKYPAADIVVAADNDQFTDGNPGVKAATEAARAIGARLLVPQFDDLASRPTDFNDLRLLAGVDAVRAAFEPKERAIVPQQQFELPVPGIALWESLRLTLANNGTPLMNLDNVVRAIENDADLKGHIWYDEFLDAIVTDWQGPERQWKDADDVKLQLYMQRHVGLHRIGVQTCHDAALVAAFHDTRNECRAYLENVSWDGVERLSDLFPVGFGAKRDAYTEAVGRCWVISMVARVMQPGCKVDTVPVLEGTQGKGKSTALGILGGKWFVECHENVLSKDFFGVLQGHMLVEISEMHSFSRAEVERIKGIISCQVDRYRKAYGRNTEDHPRQTVLACTTNRDDWQKDDTGARRFWPVMCHDIDHEWLRENRDQLFAEAVALYRMGTPWWEVPADLQAEEADARRDVDSWEPLVEEWLLGRDRVQMHEILSDCLRIEVGRHDQLIQKRVGRIMRALGWGRHVLRDEHGRNRKAWARLG